MLAVGYLASGKLALLLAVPPGYASPIFPPAGISVAAMLIGGPATLPWTFLGSFLLNLWTGYVAGTGWSWMQTLGRNSLMVYWVHVMIVYGSLVRPIKRSLSISQAALATVLVTLAMVALSAAWLQWKAKRSARNEARGARNLAPIAP